MGKQKSKFGFLRFCVSLWRHWLGDEILRCIGLEGFTQSKLPSFLSQAFFSFRLWLINRRDRNDLELETRLRRCYPINGLTNAPRHITHRRGAGKSSSSTFSFSFICLFCKRFSWRLRILWRLNYNESDKINHFLMAPWNCWWHYECRSQMVGSCLWEHYSIIEWLAVIKKLRQSVDSSGS